jgi:excisionase family DNA binding protein
MAFNLDRESAAERLGVSSRTIDRHIQAGRIRTRRIGKKMFLEEEDIESIRSTDPARSREDYIVITDDEKKYSQEIVHPVKQEAGAWSEFTRLYTEAQELIAKKDAVIQDLAYRLGKSETELKNSISMIEYKKATFLLESAKSKNDQDSHILTEKVATLESEITKRNAAIISLAILFVLVLAFSFMFFFYSRL